MTSKRTGYFDNLPINMYSRPMHDSLVEYINRANNRRLKPEQLAFGEPVVLDNEGQVSVDVDLTDIPTITFGSTRKLVYRRVNVSDLFDGTYLTVHAPGYDSESIVNALKEQWNFFLDENTYTLMEVDQNGNPLPVVEDGEPPVGLMNLSDGDIDEGDNESGTPGDVIPDNGLTDPDDPDNVLDDGEGDGDTGDLPDDGLDGEEEPVDENPPVDPEPEPVVLERYFLLGFLNNHLLLEGSFIIKVVKSIELLGTTISRLLDIRQYYGSLATGKYPVELLLRNETIVLEKADAHSLYKAKQEPNAVLIASLLTKLTGDNWVASNESTEFNVEGYELIYNGIRDPRYGDSLVEYPYIYVLRLSDEHCSNLQGTILINYRNGEHKAPGFIGGLIRPVPTYHF